MKWSAEVAHAERWGGGDGKKTHGTGGDSGENGGVCVTCGRKRGRWRSAD